MVQHHPVIAQLHRVVGAAGVLGDPNELRVYESDGFPIARGLPTAVVFPTDTDQVAACVKILSAHGLQIVPRGSGTGLAGGAVVYDGGVIISTTRMTKIESIDLNNRVAVVQAGVPNLALSDALAGTGWHYSPDPSSQRASTIGGNVATNAGGINTLKYGVTSNHILGIELVLPDATVCQAAANPLHDGFGPDLAGLICGSEGTFGIITRVWCRLVPEPRHFRTFYAVFDSTYNACQTVSDVIAAGVLPTSMEMMDGGMIQAVEQAFHYGFPTTAQALLLLELDGLDEVLDEQMDQVVQIARSNGAGDIKQCSDPDQRAQLWSARKKAFGAVGRISHSYCTQDACVPRSKLPEVMEHVAELGETFGIKITNVFHAGDGNIHPILLFDEDDPDQVQRTLQLSEQILEYCISIGGTITGEHGVGVEKLHLMPRMFNPATIDTFQRIKKAFDPGRRINDAKVIPSDKLRIELLKPAASNSPGGALITQR
ncbi:MAG: FAD-linked oxidase C-terminal domain-containing protein [Phycisphaeraceae bacterium]